MAKSKGRKRAGRVTRRIGMPVAVPLPRAAQALMEEFCAQNPQRTITFNWEDRPCTLTYRPSPILINQLRGLDKVQGGRWAAMSKMLVGCVTEWGLTRSGEPVPITEEAIMHLVAGLPLRMLRAIDRDLAARFKEFAVAQGIPTPDDDIET